MARRAARSNPVSRSDSAFAAKLVAGNRPDRSAERQESRLGRSRTHAASTATLALVLATALASQTAFASPARRLARRGVVVTPPPAAIVVPPPLVPPPLIPAPPWAWRRLAFVPTPVPPGVAIVPFPALAAPSVAVEQSAGKTPGRVEQSPSPSTAAPANGAAAAASAQAPVAGTPRPQAASAVERIPPPRPAAAVPDSAFTAAWYARHPEAWRPEGQPGNWWQPADAATIAGWLGRPVVRAGGVADAERVAQARADTVADDGLRSVLVLPSGRGDDGGDKGWLPLGVFVVTPPGGGAAHNYQQLAVDHSGAIKGNFYDAISDTVLPIAGAIDPETLAASWTVGTNGSRFEAPAAVFASGSRTVTVTSGGGSRELELLPVSAP